MARFNPPEPFSSKPNEWLEWLDEFIAIFQIAKKLHKEEGDVQRDSLLDAMGGGGGGGATSKHNLSHIDVCCTRSRHQIRDTGEQINGVFYSAKKCDSRTLCISKLTAASK